MKTEEISKSAEEAKHTPLPWRADGEDFICSGESKDIVMIRGWGWLHKKFGVLEAIKVQQANKEFILTACNSHYQLLQENADLKLKCAELNASKNELLEALTMMVQIASDSGFRPDNEIDEGHCDRIRELLSRYKPLHPKTKNKSLEEGNKIKSFGEKQGFYCNGVAETGECTWPHCGCQPH